MPHILSGNLEVPFQTAGDGSMGHVGRADVGCGKATIALEVIRLGVKPGSLNIVGDANLDVWQVRQPFHRRGIGGSHVGGGNQPHRYITVMQILKGRQQQAQAGPFDKGNKYVHPIGGAHLFQQFMTKLRFLR